MAGDWIKFETVTPDKPEVFQIAAELGISPEAAVGHLLRVWIWADQQSLDGHALCVTDVTLDAVSRRDGFATAMRNAGWLHGKDGKLALPNFERHNGESAKKRALSTRRKQRERAEKPSRNERDKNATREEKRRVLNPKSLSEGLDAQQVAQKLTPRQAGTNPRATGTNPRAQGTSPRQTGQNPKSGSDKLNGKLRARILSSRGPDQLANACKAAGIGLPPPGMGFEDGKQWAIKKYDTETRH